jgi:hypothetical protein
MKRDKETAGQVEARLERSLRRQVTAPKLDGRFDAAVWQRIANEDRAVARTNAASTAATTTRMPRWLVACNVLGIAVTAVLVLWFGVRQLSGIDLGLDLGVDLPAFSAEQQQSLLRLATNVLAAAAVLFGLMFTRFGRRLLSALR